MQLGTMDILLQPVLHEHAACPPAPSGGQPTSMQAIPMQATQANPMQKSTILRTLVLALPLVLGLSACDEPEAAEQTQEEELPDIKVELPDSPNFEEARAPEKYDDGDFSIFGLRLNIDERLKEGEAGQEVIIKGWVQEIYVPPVCPEGELCPPGKQPHFWITDAQDEQGKKRAMMVVNYRFQIAEWQAKDWKGQPDVILEKGKQYTFKGIFAQFSGTGFSADNGLLEFRTYKPLTPTIDPVTKAPLEWVAPPGAAWHPLTIAQQEASNAAMAEKAAKTAIKQPGPK